VKLVEIAFFTDDVAGMAGFYQALLGEPPVARSEGMAIFVTGDTKIFIHKNYTPAEGDLPPENHMAFEVADVDGACRELEAAGWTVDVPPSDYYWGRSAYLRDPDGHQVELAQPGEST